MVKVLIVLFLLNSFFYLIDLLLGRKDESLLRFLEHKTFFIHLNDNQQMNSVIESLVNVGAEQVGDFIDADLVILRYRDDFFFQVILPFQSLLIDVFLG